MSKAEPIAAMVAQAEPEVGSLDILVNNARRAVHRSGPGFPRRAIGIPAMSGLTPAGITSMTAATILFELLCVLAQVRVQRELTMEARSNDQW
jgi:NAD(P)-dependent dehydrogenase (short-subunit alcohol dehydrogenase family)